jgi:hypothetical protein
MEHTNTIVWPSSQQGLIERIAANGESKGISILTDLLRIRGLTRKLF